uniref:Sphingolipid C4-hydroxylase SUR2 n=1 Tax=Cajanus cajan TaxID=3821 RepID=A0A151QQV7_CAJCA|nr:Sphingolipid C4-hydroxylase SUR2 [Cajanus cajan]
MVLEVSDEILGTFVPIVVYWVYSGIYFLVGLFCDNSRLHSKEDEDQKIMVTKSEVLRGVLFQQAMQAVVTIILFKVTSVKKLDNVSLPVSAIKLVFGMAMMDTWQYLMHHSMLFLHKHNTLTVPFSFGALYNKPIEGFLLDTVGGAFSFLASGMTPRVAIFFFSFTTIKTVDDHCGFWLPRINPFHKFFYNNAASQCSHDVHY